MEKICGDSEVIRVIDPRLGAASYQKAEGSSNIIDDLSDEDIIVQPAEALDIETGLQAINNLLAWDREKEMGLDNHPKLMFSDEWKLISCMQAYRNMEFEESVRTLLIWPVTLRWEILNILMRRNMATGGGSY